MNHLPELLNAWGIEFATEDSTAPIEGSPERTATRTVAVDTSGRRWILEQIEQHNRNRKQEIAEQLKALCDAGLLLIHPWMQTRSNSFFQALEKPQRGGTDVLQPSESVDAASSPRFQCMERSCWMLRPYIDGIPLDRETWLTELWRIDAMADFLLNLHVHGAERFPSTGGVPEERGGFFSITDYAVDRMNVWRTRYPQLASRLEAPFQTLEKTFFPIHDSLPTAFCHGDFHPVNVVWGEQGIHSVIDWEFCGIKPEFYDVALLLGCTGFEDPDNLLREPARRLLGRLRSAGFGAEESWGSLLDLTAAIRFGWMSEWIRRGEEDTAEMEVVYLDILTGQKDYIWQALNT